MVVFILGYCSSHKKGGENAKAHCSAQDRIENTNRETQWATPGTSTVGQMAVRGPYGEECVSNRIPGMCVSTRMHAFLHVQVWIYAIWSTICVPMDCVYRAQHKAAVLCVPMCEGNKLAFGQFAGPNILAATGQTDPQHEWPYRGRWAKYTELLTSVGQQQCTTTHGPTGVAQQHAQTHEHEYRTRAWPSKTSAGLSYVPWRKKRDVTLLLPCKPRARLRIHLYKTRPSCKKRAPPVLVV